MISRLEDTLSRCNQSNVAIRRQIFYHLDHGRTLRTVRCVSRVLHDLIDHHLDRLFQDLYVHAPLNPGDSLGSLRVIAPFCHTLTIKVGYRQNEHSALSISGSNDNGERDSVLHHRNASPVGRYPSALGRSSRKYPTVQSGTPSSIPLSPLCPVSNRIRDTERLRWTNILSHFHRLRHLTLRVNGDPAWSGQTHIEATLVDLRVAVENAGLSCLRTLILSPIHAMGIVHLRWSGFGAFGETSTLSAQTWQRISVLEVCMHSPLGTGALSSTQERMFTQIFHDYVRSFAPTLRCLRFKWLGNREGPSPLTLDLEPGFTSLRPIFWPRLEELWIGNVILPHGTVRTIRERAPNLTVFKALPSIHRSLRTNTWDQGATVEVVLGSHIGPSTDRQDAVDEVYNHGDTDCVDDSDEISLRSRVVPIFLDL